MSADRSRSVSDALAAAGRVLVDRPAAVLPAYLLAVGLPTAAQVPLLVALGVAAAYLLAGGRVEALVEAFPDVGRGAAAPGGGSGTGAPPSLTPDQQAALAGLADPVVVGLLAVGGVLTLVAGLLLRAVSVAVTREAVWAALDGRPPLVDGVRGSRRWRTFLGLILLRALVGVVLVGVPLAITATLAAGALADGVAVGGPSPALGAAALVGLLLVGLGGVLSLFVLLLLSFADAAVVVDDLGALAAARRSVGFVRHNLVATAGFVLVFVGVSVGVGVLLALAGVVGVTRLGAVVVPLLVTPLLDAFTTALYADRTLAPADRPAATGRVCRTLARGWRDLVGFVTHHPGAVAAAHAVLFGAIAAGYAVTARYGVRFDPPGDVGNVFGAFPVGTFVTIGANNWLVAVGSAYGGLAAGVPAAVTLAFNGALVGALAGVFDLTAFLALVAPHGVLELPTLAVAGGLGLHLGAVGWRGVRGGTDAAAVADAVRRAAFVLVGVGLLLVVAAFVEAFVTPAVAAWVLG